MASAEALKVGAVVAESDVEQRHVFDKHLENGRITHIPKRSGNHDAVGGGNALGLLHNLLWHIAAGALCKHFSPYRLRVVAIEHDGFNLISFAQLFHNGLQNLFCA